MAKSARRSRGTTGRRTQPGSKTSPKPSAVRREHGTTRGASSARRTTKRATKSARSRKNASERPVHRTAGASGSAIGGESKGKLERARLPRPATKAGRGRAAAAAPETNEGKYVYCVIKSERRLSFGTLGIGIEPAEVHTVEFRDIAAVVSGTPMVALDPTRDNVLSHQRVNETVMQDHTVIPMSFGTVFKTDDDIIELLRSAYDAFTDVLNKMQDKLEFGLKVLWDRDQIIHEIEAEDEDIRRLKG